MHIKTVSYLLTFNFTVEKLVKKIITAQSAQELTKLVRSNTNKKDKCAINYTRAAALSK